MLQYNQRTSQKQETSPTMAGRAIAGQAMGLLRARAAATSSLRTRSGMGLPVGTTPPPDKPIPMQDELIWDDGSAFPEPCLDRVGPMVGKYEALAWLCGGLGFFGLVGLLAVWNDKASKIPYTPREYPFDNLRVELGGDPNAMSTAKN